MSTSVEPVVRPRTRVRRARRIRVCQFTPSLSGGGAEERIARVIDSMDRDEFDLAWIGFGDVQHGLIARAGLGVDVVSIARDAARGVEPKLIGRIALALSRIKPDVLHTHNWSTSLYGIAAARLVGVPTVIYGEGGRDSPAGPSRRRRALMRALAPHVDRFTAVCEFLGRELEEHWRVPEQRVHVIPNGVDLDRVDTAPPKRDARKRLGVPEDAFVVGTIAGRFRAVKRLPNLVDAVGRIASRHPNMHLLLVGDPLELREELTARARSRGLGERFHLPGHIEGAHTVLNAFDVVVNCSSFEGASNAVLEAMGARKPVVATAVGGTPEVIEDGKSGLLVPPDDVERLARAIARFAEDGELRRACSERARQQIEARHTHQAMFESYAHLYRSTKLVEPPRAPWRTLKGIGASMMRLPERDLT
jgi:glycosyltransferase involved in cell wall biosynthesis